MVDDALIQSANRYPVKVPDFDAPGFRPTLAPMHWIAWRDGAGGDAPFERHPLIA